MVTRVGSTTTPKVTVQELFAGMVPPATLMAVSLPTKAPPLVFVKVAPQVPPVVTGVATISGVGSESVKEALVSGPMLGLVSVMVAVLVPVTWRVLGLKLWYR